MSTILKPIGDPISYIQKDVRSRVVVTKASEDRLRLALSYLSENGIAQITSFETQTVWVPATQFGGRSS